MNTLVTGGTEFVGSHLVRDTCLDPLVEYLSSL